MKKVVTRLLLVVAVLGAGYGIYRLIQGLPSRQQTVPTTRVRRGDVVVRSFARGELRAVRSATLTAPNLFGTVQVTKLAPMGSFAREKDLIVEFDDSEVLSRLEQRQLELEQVDEQIKKAQADLAIRNNQDQVDLLRARYSVRRAELEVKKNPLLPAIDQKKNLLNLEEAQRRLRQLESDIKSKQEQALAELNVLRERRNRNLLDINREKQRLMQVKLLAPISGLVAIKQNRSGFSGMFGTQIPDIREGDQVQPGMPVAEILDLSELEVIARIGELDRANLHEGQDVLIRLDALAGKVFHGKIKSMSGTASANVFSADPGKKFDVLFSIDMKELLTELGAKPEQIARILATAEANRKKPIATPTLSMFGGMPDFSAMAAAAGGMPGAGGMGGGAAIAFGQGGAGQMPGMGGGMPGAMGQSGDGQGQRRAFMMMGGAGGMGGMGGGMMFGGAQLTPEQQKKMQEIFQ
ncbi:MAG: efflux RND transporter periplasmic adaptor subunit, partial [Bryobacteraceae bacterium]|nr:efflux RND transporter periplasmic adaptor subunit [Bryobacteraceae bacterium]